MFAWRSLYEVPVYICLLVRTNCLYFVDLDKLYRTKSGMHKVRLLFFYSLNVLN